MKRKAALIRVSDTSLWEYVSLSVWLSVCLYTHFTYKNTPAKKEDTK
jgi:hypothetical protein